LLIVPLALLCALTASDAREKKDRRDQCIALLEKMTPMHFLLAGLSADYSYECMQFLRGFDAADPDPAACHHMLETFFGRMRNLFHQAHILEEVPGGKLEDQTFTFLAIKNAREAPPITVGDRQFTLWPSHCKIAKADAKLAMESIQLCVDLMIERIKADISHSDVVLDLSVFRLQTLHAARKIGRYHDWETDCKVRLGRLFRMLNLDVSRGRVEFFQAAALLYESEDHQQLLSKSVDFDNRQAWRAVLSQTFQQRCCQEGVLHALPDLVQFYLALEIGTGQVERDLGLTSMVNKVLNSGPEHIETVSSYVEIIADGPKREEELYRRVVPTSATVETLSSWDDVVHRSVCSDRSVVLLPTPFSRALHSYWLEAHGRRFRSYKQRSDTGVLRGHKKGSEQSFVSSSAKGRSRLAQKEGVDNQLLGAARFTFLHQGRRPLETEALKRFHANTLRKQSNQQKLSQRRRQGLNPYPVGDVCKGRIFADHKTQRATEAPRDTQPTVLDVCLSPISTSNAHQLRVTRLPVMREDATSGVKVRRLVSAVQSAGVLVIDNTANLELLSCKSGTIIITMFVLFSSCRFQMYFDELVLVAQVPQRGDSTLAFHPNI
jgi:hypothetical protein